MSKGDKSIIESDETFGEMLQKPDDPGTRHISELNTVSKKNTVKTSFLNDAREARNANTHDPEQGSITIGSPPDNLANSKSINYIPINEARKKDPESSQLSKTSSRRNSLTKGITGPILTTNPQNHSLK